MLSGYEKPQPPVYQNAPWQTIKTGDFHLISISKEAIAELDGETFIGVFNSNGLCMGITKISEKIGNQLLIGYGDDLTTDFKDGFTNDEQMEFRVYDPDSKDTFIAEVTFDASMPDSDAYKNYGQSMIKSIDLNSTNIPENSLNGKIQIIPNPAHDAFTLRVAEEPMEGGMLHLYNMEGQLIMESRLNAKENNVRIGHLSKGIYIVNVTINGQAINKRLIKE